ncbi:hypothetical protein Tco_0109246 [Tanacetum coccineum]
MSLGNMCHGGTNYLTGKYVGPTLSLGIVAGERIPSERSPANIPQRQVARETYPQRQVARKSPKMSLGIAVNVVVAVVESLLPKYMYAHHVQLTATTDHELQQLRCQLLGHNPASNPKHGSNGAKQQPNPNRHFDN